MSGTGVPVPRVVALGGGHGLFASLSALRTLQVDITAVVTVADDGGSSGRIRRELGVLPPGDLRMALAALATRSLDASSLATSSPDATSLDASSPDASSLAASSLDASSPNVSSPNVPDGTAWPDVLQHRLGGTGALAGHPIGNLLLTGLMELHGEPVRALDELGGLVGARGRVLPMSLDPLDLIAEVASVDSDDPVRQRRIRGQSAIASTAGRVTAIRLVPPDAPACPAAVEAILAADAVILGPGSWFTSVIPHLLVPELAAALAATTARRIVVLNLEQQAGETEGFSPQQHLRALHEHCPHLRVDTVVADSEAVLDAAALRGYISRRQAQLLLAPVASRSEAARHDPDRLGRVLADAIGIPAAAGSGHRTGAGERRSTEQGVR